MEVSPAHNLKRDDMARIEFVRRVSDEARERIARHLEMIVEGEYKAGAAGFPPMGPENINAVVEEIVDIIMED